MYHDSINHRRHAGKRAAAEAHARDLEEPAFDEIQPRAAGRHEVKVHARMTAEPSAHGWAFVGAQVVQDDMQLLSLRGRVVEAPQELHELLTAMAPPAFADHDAVQDPQRGVTDAEVLALAARDGRILVTHDQTTMPRYFGEFIRSTVSK